MDDGEGEDEAMFRRLENYVPPHLRNPDDDQVIYMQWNSGWGSWEQVIEEAKGREGVVAWRRVPPQNT